MLQYIVSTLVGIGNALALVSSPVPSAVSPKVKITNNREICCCRIADPLLPNKEQADGFGAESQQQCTLPIWSQGSALCELPTAQQLLKSVEWENSTCLLLKTGTFGYKCWNRSPRSSTKSPHRKTTAQKPDMNKYYPDYMKHFNQQNINTNEALSL